MATNGTAALWDSAAEAAVIGCIFLDKSVIDRITLTPEDFHDPHHRVIYEICVKMHYDGLPVDPRLFLMMWRAYYQEKGITPNLERENEVFVIVTDSLSAAHTAENVTHYADVVRRYSVKRTQALLIGQAMRTAAEEHDPEKALDVLRNGLRKTSAAVRKALAGRQMPGLVPYQQQEEQPATLVLRSRSKATVVDIISNNLRGVLCSDEGDGYEDPLRMPRLEFNEMTRSMEIDRKPIQDWQVTEIAIRIERRFINKKGEGLIQSDEDVRKGMESVARKSSYHPVREYLKESAAKYDGLRRVSLLLERGLKVPATPLTVTMMRHWLTGAVVRAYWPGSKVDTVLLLVGGQGVHKGQFFQRLASPWYVETDADIGSKDTPDVMRQGWIVELAEMESLLRARDQASTKAFITRCEDVYRSPYAHFAICHPRSFVLAASTNEDCPLTDDTGNRRTWPIRVDQQFDLEYIESIRDDIWGETAHRVDEMLKNGVISLRQTKNGVVAVCSPKSYAWWLTPDEEEELKNLHSGFYRRHPWADLVVSYIKDRAKVTMNQLFEECLVLSKDKWTSPNMRILADILRKEGWKHHEHTKRYGAYWSPPDPTWGGPAPL